MNSCLYRASLMHHRLEPRKHRFHYEVFMFCLDLDEIDGLAKKLRFMSRNRFNLFNFRDRDHLQLPAENPDRSRNTREHITDYLLTRGISIGRGRIMLITNLRTLGHQFNPVSFYYCYDEAGPPLCAIAEVGNTFGEMKPYFLGGSTGTGASFRLRAPKYFYVSPFTDMDAHFDFDLGIPGEKWQARIDDYDKQGKRFFISTVNGRRKALTDANLLRYFARFPFITLQVIGSIHWQAFKLWLKKLPYHKKNEHTDLQQDVFRPSKPTEQTH
jgi:DUF1365 family protein